MININEIVLMLKTNGLDITSSLESVDSLLKQLNYNEGDKQEVVSSLKAQGWFLSSTPIVPPSANVGPSPTLLVSSDNSSSWRGVIIIIFVLAVIIIAGGVTYAYVTKMWPFSLSAYSEEDFLSNVLNNSSKITSASYSVSLALNVSKRDQDANPFSVQVSNNLELKQRYTNDLKRSEDVSTILNMLTMTSNYSRYSSKNAKSYPVGIKNLLTVNQRVDSSVSDPVTKTDYEYHTLNGGKDFSLTVNFETADAVKQILSQQYGAPTSTSAVGTKVTFSRDSSSNVYLSSEPPKPFLVKMSESTKMISPEFDVKASFGVQSQLNVGQMADWLFNLEGEGNFGDLSYKVSADALKKGENYYFKINNAPSILLFGDLAAVKGKWVKISTATSSIATTSSYSFLSSLKTKFPEMEKDYMKNREKSVKFLRVIVDVASEEKLIAFKTKPKTERVEGRQLVRYDLAIRKESILPFYDKLRQKISDDPDFSDFRNLIDEGLVEYLKSNEFEQVFDYFNKNDSLTLWIDDQGYPAVLRNSVRVVPPDTATQLVDKQVNFIFNLTLKDINKSVNIVAPTDFVSIEKIIADYQKNLNFSY